jgi:hypothetical protein
MDAGAIQLDAAKSSVKVVGNAILLGNPLESSLLSDGGGATAATQYTLGGRQ